LNVEKNDNFMYRRVVNTKDRTKGGGRPPKFDEPRRPITMTLPERILDQLAEVDKDRACAVVKVTEAVSGTTKEHFNPVELIEMTPGKSLIVVGPSKALRKIAWLKLIEIAQTRYLLAIPSGTPIEALEVALRDLFHNSEVQKNKREISILNELLDIIGHQRRSQRLSKSEILVIDTGESAKVSSKDHR
jgi:hypothetical protein